MLAILLVDLFAIWSSQAELSLLRRVEAGAFVSDAEATRSDNRQIAVGFAQLGIYIVCVVTFIAWFVQAYRNVEALGAGGMRF